MHPDHVPRLIRRARVQKIHAPLQQDVQFMHGIGRPAESEHHAEGPATRVLRFKFRRQKLKSEQQCHREHGNGKEINDISGMP